MNHIGADILAKIKSAIKAKLLELGSYVDNELSDYIMVMVANKKSPDQVKADLSIFLGHNVDPFTTWLFDVLEKLKAITIGIEAKSKPQPAEQPKNGHPDDILVLSKKPDEAGNSKAKNSDRDRGPPVKHDRMEKLSRTRRTEEHVEQYNPEEPQYRAKQQATSRVEAETRRGPPRMASRIGAVLSHDSDEEYDPERVLRRSLASKIMVPGRKKLPASRQASVGVLLKAIADADKSIKKRHQEAEGRRIELLGARQLSHSNVVAVAQPTGDLRSKLKRRSMLTELSNETPEKQARPSAMTDSSPSSKPLISRPSGSSSSSSRPSGTCATSEGDPPAPTCADTQFIVTMEGVDSSYFRSRRLSQKQDAANGPAAQPMPNRSGSLSVKEQVGSTRPPESMQAGDKKVRARISAPGPEYNTRASWARASLPPAATTRLHAAAAGGRSSSSTTCRYWPHCSRGASCFYYHPEISSRDKYHWSPPASLAP